MAGEKKTNRLYMGAVPVGLAGLWAGTQTEAEVLYGPPPSEMTVSAVSSAQGDDSTLFSEKTAGSQANSTSQSTSVPLMPPENTELYAPPNFTYEPPGFNFLYLVLPVIIFLVGIGVYLRAGTSPKAKKVLKIVGVCLLALLLLSAAAYLLFWFNAPLFSLTRRI